MNQADNQVIGASTNDGQDYQDRQTVWFARAVNADRRYTIYGPKCFKDAKKAGHQQDDLPSSEPISTSDKIEALLVSEISSPGEAIAALEEVIRRLQNKKKTDAKKAHSEKPAPGSYLGWNSEPNPKLIVPDTAHVLYSNRVDKKQDAISFLRDEWGKYIIAGTLYLDKLRLLDLGLVDAIYSRCRTENLVPREVLPPHSVVRVEGLSAEERLARHRDLTRQRVSRTRAKAKLEGTAADIGSRPKTQSHVKRYT